MTDFFAQNVNVKRQVISAAESRMNLPAHLIEKDLMVVATLKALFSHSDSEKFLFKGGTSLSKAYGLIERFSEDIDLTFDRGLFKGNLPSDEIRSLSPKKRDEVLDQIKEEAVGYIDHVLIPYLQEEIQKIIQDSIRIESDKENPTNVYVYYESLFPEQAGSSYVRPRVLIEFGIRGDTFPAEIKTVQSYLHEAISELDPFQADVRALSPIRTFYEKLTLLHSEFHRPPEKKVAERLSRHYYDVYQLSEKGIFDLSLENLELLEVVVQHKMDFFRSRRSDYESIFKTGICIAPNKERFAEIEADYEKMTEMFFNNSPIPKFQDILEKMKKIESMINEQILKSLNQRKSKA